MKNTEFKETIQKHFGKQHYGHIENNDNTQNPTLNIPMSRRSDAGDYSGLDNSNMDGVITDRLFDADKYQNLKKDEIQEYIDDKQPLCENHKLTLYKEIFKYYNETMKGKPLKFEDIDIDEALKNIGISGRETEDGNMDDTTSKNNHSDLGSKFGHRFK